MTGLRIRCTELLALSAFLVVCGAAYPQAGSRQHRFEVRQEDGVPTAVSRGVPKYQGGLFRYEHVLTLKQAPAVLESLIAGAKGFVMTQAPPTHLGDLMVRNLFPVSVTKGQFLTMETDTETGETLLKVYRLVPAAAGFLYP